MGAASRFDDERKRAGYRSGMMTDSCNEDMRSSRPPMSIGNAQDKSAHQKSSVENIPENVMSMSSGWITSDAIRSGEICEVLPQTQSKLCERTLIFVQFQLLMSKPLQRFHRFRLDFPRSFGSIIIEEPLKMTSTSWTSVKIKGY